MSCRENCGTLGGKGEAGCGSTWIQLARAHFTLQVGVPDVKVAEGEEKPSSSSRRRWRQSPVGHLHRGEKREQGGEGSCG